MSNRIAIGQLLDAARACRSLNRALDLGERDAAKAALKLVDEGFEKERSPTGHKWKPKQSPNGERTLIETRRLRNAWIVKVQSRHRIVFENATEYAKYTNQGTRQMVARRQVPKGKLPPRWSKVMGSAIAENLKKKLAGGGFR